MKYEKHLSKLRHLALRVQGQSLKHVLLRYAASRAEGVAENVHATQEIFNAAAEKIYTRTNELSAADSFYMVSDVTLLQELKEELVDAAIEPFVWDETLYVLLDGLDKKDRAVIEPLLNNQYAHNKSISSGSCGSITDLTSFRNLIVVMVRRIYSEMPVRNLVGIQPMQGPVGISYFLRYRRQDEETKELVDLSADSEEMIGKKITLDVVTQAVEAGSRKLQAGWTLEASQDLNSMYGLDIESEMIQALSSEIRQEITNEILSDLNAIAGEPELVKLEGDHDKQMKLLGIHINHAANEIARLTRRGAGNWIVVPMLLGTAISQISTFKKADHGGFKISCDLMELGTLNGTIKVFTSLEAESDEILVGYKGGSGECDAGYVHLPYIPVMDSGVVVHPKTFQPLITLMTRYGKALNGGDWHKDDDQPHLASKYYKRLKIESDLLVLTKEDE